MDAKQKLIKNQELYHLWFEYLKENKPYKFLCGWAKKEPELFHTPEKWADDDIPTEVRDCGYFWFAYLIYCLKWGNVHNISWNEKLNEFLNIIDEYNQIKKDISSLINKEYFGYRNQLSSQIIAYTEYYKKKFQKEPSLREFREHCLFMESGDEFPPNPSRILPPKEIKSLWSNLKIWQAVKKNKMELQEAIQTVDPEGIIHTGKPGSIWRSWERDIVYAERIIENVARGAFPGDYKKMPNPILTISL